MRIAVAWTIVLVALAACGEDPASTGSGPAGTATGTGATSTGGTGAGAGAAGGAGAATSTSSAGGAGGAGGTTCSGDDTKPVALNDLGACTYLGFQGGLYPAGSNDVPAAHAAEGAKRANAIEPLDAAGNPDPQGKYVLLSIGMSNTTMEFCAATNVGTICPCSCEPWSFMGQAAAASEVDTSHLVIVNGAAGSQTAVSWDAPNNPDYDMVLTNRLAPSGLTEAQVQVVWLKVADPQPTVSLADNPAPPASAPDAGTADAYFLESEIGKDVRALETRYPNLRMVFLSSRIYAGYAKSGLNPEPYAYESGFAVKWAVEAQIAQMANAGQVVDQVAGDLDYGAAAPWLAWGPYLWADGTNARSDGLTWVESDYSTSDGTHPAQGARTKVGKMLLDFFEGKPVAGSASTATACWFTSAGSCP